MIIVVDSRPIYTSFRIFFYTIVEANITICNLYVMDPEDDDNMLAFYLMGD